MCGGSGGDPGADARKQDEERRARIEAATATINHVFSGDQKLTKTRVVPGTAGAWKAVPGEWDGGDSQVWVPGTPDKTETYDEWLAPEGGNPYQKAYVNQRNAVYDLNKNEVDRQATEAERANRFGLARTGLLGGSVNVDSTSELNRRTNEGLMRAGGIADQASADLRSADERTRSNLISLAQSGIDTGTAAQQAINGLKVNAADAAGARAGSTVGSLFSDMSQAYLMNQQNQGRQAGWQAGQQWTGVSSPSQRYAGT